MSPTGIAKTTIPELSESINAIVSKLAFHHKLPEIASEVKKMLDQLIWALKIQTIASSELMERREESQIDLSRAEFAAATPALLDLVELPSKVSEFSPDLGCKVRKLLVLLAAANLPATPDDIAASDMPLNRDQVDYDSEVQPPNSWRAIKRDHAVLLALVRGYRFLLEGSDEAVLDRYPSRLALVSKVRGLELKAASTGTVI